MKLTPQLTPQQRWEHRSEWVLAFVATIYLGLYTIHVLLRPLDVSHVTMRWILILLYLPFVIDYIARLALAEHRVHWFSRHLLDLAMVALPLIGPLRILRLVLLVAALQRAFGDAIRGRVVIYTAFSSVLLVYVSSLAVLQAERSAPGSHITKFGDAVWWSVSTITTVGYGDFYPITGRGRVIATLLMIGGISLIGTITASVAAWIVGRVAQEDTATQTATVTHIEELQLQIRQLEESVTALRSDIAKQPG